MSSFIAFKKFEYTLFLLVNVGAKGRKVRKQYQNLWCPICGKVDEIKAMAQGIDPPSRKVPQVTALRTGDGFVLMNHDGKAAFQDIFREAIQFQEIENATPLYLAYPTKIVCAHSGHRVYAVGEPSQGDFLQPRFPAEPLRHPNEPKDTKPSRTETCSGCGRFYEVTIRPDLYQCNENETLVGLLSENFSGSSLEWVVASEQANQLRAAKLPFVRIDDFVPFPPLA